MRHPFRPCQDSVRTTHKCQTAKTHSNTFFNSVAPCPNVKASPKQPQSCTDIPTGEKASQAVSAVKADITATVPQATALRNTPESRSSPKHNSPAQRHTDHAKGWSATKPLQPHTRKYSDNFNDVP